jgi:hypothetical protein
MGGSAAQEEWCCVSSKEWLASFRVGPSQRTNYYVPVLALVVCSMESANPGVDNKIATRTGWLCGRCWPRNKWWHGKDGRPFGRCES